MENAISRDELRRMRELAAKGNLTDGRTVDTSVYSDEVAAEIVHLEDVVEMQRLLARSADELERLYSRQADQ